MKLFLLIVSMLWQAPATVNGTVVVAGTSEPIPEAQIALSTSGALLETATDANGRFSLANVPAGRHTVVVRADGFFATPAAANAIPLPRAEVPVTVVEGIANSMAPVTMIRGAIITGKVVDPQGQPLPFASVRAMRQGPGDVFQYLASRQTDDQGEYRLFWVPPGEYVIGVSPRPPAPANLTAGPPPGGPQVSRVVTTMFPNATDIAGASKVAVKAGDEVRGIDISARLDLSNPPPSSAPTTFKISGQILNEVTAATRVPATLTLGSKNGGIRDVSQVALSPGTMPFEIPPVPAGSYELFVRAAGVRGSPDPVYGPTVWGYTTLEVRDRNIDDVRLTIQPSVDVPGVVKIDGKAASAGGNLKIGLTPLGAAANFNNYRLIMDRLQTPGNDGKFAIPLAATGNYDVFVQGAPANSYLADIRHRDTSILSGGIEVRGTVPATFEVLLATDGGTVEGLVTNSDKSPAGSVSVVLAPEDRQLLRFTRIVTTDAEGRYSIRNVRPGEYKLFAVVSPISLNAVNPELLSIYDAKGVKTTVKAAGTTKAEVVVISY